MVDRETLHTRARILRTNVTDAERMLWYHLRARRFQNLKFRRQVVVGNFIVDFICHTEKIIIELDGGQHLEQKRYDYERTQYLKTNGFSVIRFWNHEVLNDVNSVLEKLFELCRLNH